MENILAGTLWAGAGWFFGVMTSVAILFANGLMTSRILEEALGNALVLAFPGIILFFIALILVIKKA